MVFNSSCMNTWFTRMQCCLAAPPPPLRDTSLLLPTTTLPPPYSASCPPPPLRDTSLLPTTTPTPIATPTAPPRFTSISWLLHLCMQNLQLQYRLSHYNTEAVSPLCIICNSHKNTSNLYTFIHLQLKYRPLHKNTIFYNYSSLKTIELYNIVLTRALQYCTRT